MCVLDNTVILGCSLVSLEVCLPVHLREWLCMNVHFYVGKISFCNNHLKMSSQA